ncbi:MAG: GIY-YIG nuclease family protein [Bacteroidetes bacterium]|nr:GIY-YIG nuclease family protein [Bacteroidota bacterium]
MFYLYIIKSRLKNRYYTGQTKDLKNRIKEHNAGKTKSIKAYIPFDLIYFETFKTREEAVSRERYFKSGSWREYIRKYLSNWIEYLTSDQVVEGSNPSGRTIKP